MQRAKIKLFLVLGVVGLAYSFWYAFKIHGSTVCNLARLYSGVILDDK